MTLIIILIYYKHYYTNNYIGAFILRFNLFLTKGEHSKSLNKIVHLNHRRFLSPDRKERTGFPSNKCPKPVPIPKDVPFIIKTISRLEKSTQKKKKYALNTPYRIQR